MALRVAAINALGSLPLSRSPQLDSLEYLLWARHLSESGFVWPEYPEHAPGYSFFVGTLFQSERRALRGEMAPIVRAFVTAAASRP